VEVNHKVKDPMKEQHIDFSPLNKEIIIPKENNSPFKNKLRQNG
jgi:hypothetical protein